MVFELKDLDPDKIMKDSRFPDYFYVEVINHLINSQKKSILYCGIIILEYLMNWWVQVKFTDYCKCKNTTLFEDKCKDCRKFMHEVKP